MSELVVTAAGFILQPTARLNNGPAILRWAYNRPFLDSNGVQVFGGTQTSGFGIEVPCSIADGLISVDQDSLLWTTDNAQDPSPASIWISAWLLTPRRVLIAALTVIGKTQLVVTESLTPSCTWEAFSNYNQAVNIGNAPDFWYTAAEVNRVVDQAFDTHPASDNDLGTVLLTVPADIPASPVVWGANDPLVRDAVAIQGVDVSVTAPLDTQTLIFNQATNQYEPGNQNPGTGNVVSNEVSSVDGQVALASGTGGKTIKFSSIIDDGTNFNATGMRVIASEYDSDSANLADNGTIRLNKDDFIAWRNEANGGNVILDKDASDRIASSGGFAGALTGNVTGDVTGNLTGTASLATNVADGDKGDITVTAGVWAIDDETVTYAKMQNVSAADRLLGRGNGAGAGDVQEIQLGTNLSMTGTTLNASAGTGTVGNVGTLTSNEVIIGQGGTDITALGSLGTTTTVLHGNAAGAPSFGVVTPSDAAGNTTGSGNFALATSPTLVTPIISVTAAHGSDDTYGGLQITGLNAGATIAQWEAVYLDSSSTWQLADANGSGTYPARGLAVAAYVNTNPASILTCGTVRNDAWNWTPGGPIYLSGTPGALTQTAPSTSGDKVQVVGYALTADIAFFDFNSTYLTVT